jgi:apolipoprotein N-acyltransferase
VRDETPIFTQFTGTFNVEQARVSTPYVRYGDWVSAVCAILTVGLVGFALITRRGAAT